jgi:AcrR family transcriptional regulator
MSEPLPLLTSPPAERRDAARNREALLRAAIELVDECGVDSVTTEAVAERAGVGKGTVFRRFASRAGLMGAVLDHSEQEWQAAVMSGPPPLGPGADPFERLLALGRSRLRLNLRHTALISAAGQPGAISFDALSFVTMHVRVLLSALGVQGDLPYLASALVAPLELAARREGEVTGETLERLDAGWADLAHRVVNR